VEKLSLNSIWNGWTLTGELGGGTHGKVYAAEKTDPDGVVSRCAVKEILMAPRTEPIKEAIELGVNAEDLEDYFDLFRDNLQKELDRYKDADSPHLAKYEDCEFVTDEEVPGWTGYLRRGLYKTLTEHFEGAPMGEAEAVAVGCDICRALIEYERVGLVHGGISPSNVMADQEGNFLLVDHGIAKCSVTAGYRLFGGDRSYDAPEVVARRTYSHGADIYSLGMTLRYIVNGGELSDTWRMASSGRFADILDRATAEDPKDRYRTAGDLLRALEAMTGKAETPIVLKETEPESEADAFDFIDDEDEEGYKKPYRKLIVGGLIALAVIAAVIALLITKPWSSNKSNDTVEEQVTEKVTSESDTAATSDKTGNATSDPDPDEPAANTEQDKPDDAVAEDDIIDVDDDAERLKEDLESGSELLENYEPARAYGLDTETVKESELDSMSRLETYMLLNEIYARHGKIFPDEEIQRYFDKQEWYVPVTASSEEVIREFNDIEIRNLNLIVRYQIEHGYR
jgi:serine/threonine protein kinase